MAKIQMILITIEQAQEIADYLQEQRFKDVVKLLTVLKQAPVTEVDSENLPTPAPPLEKVGPDPEAMAAWKGIVDTAQKEVKATRNMKKQLATAALKNGKADKRQILGG